VAIGNMILHFSIGRLIIVNRDEKPFAVGIAILAFGHPTPHIVTIIVFNQEVVRSDRTFA